LIIKIKLSTISRKEVFANVGAVMPPLGWRAFYHEVPRGREKEGA
jgi:hypothetical protein